MREKMKSFREWFSEHKKLLLGVGVSMVGTICVFWVCKNQPEAVGELLKRGASVDGNDSKQDRMEETDTMTILPITCSEGDDIVAMKSLCNVDMFIRKLPQGQSASEYKLHEAERLGIELEPGHTIVDPHTRGYAA